LLIRLLEAAKWREEASQASWRCGNFSALASEKPRPNNQSMFKVPASFNINITRIIETFETLLMFRGVSSFIELCG